jgi:hypothetical protein
MSFHHSPKIVTDGLVLCLDAANIKSYSGSGTIWRDLAGSNNGTLTNGPTYTNSNGGNIVFDGSNDYASINPMILNTPWSFCCFFKQTNNTLWSSLYSQDGLFLWIGLIPSSRAIRIHTNISSGLDTPSNVYDLNVPVFLGISSSPSVLTVFINNNKYSLTAGGNPSFANTSKIASYSDGSKDFFTGAIYSISMYNRNISDREILQNYNALKGRFNL